MTTSRLARTCAVLLAVLPASARAESPDELLAARDSALIAGADPRAFARAHDRALLALSKPQRFGMEQGPDGRPLAPVADTMPESLRADFLVPPLIRALDVGVEEAERSAAPHLEARLSSRRDAQPLERLATLASRQGRLGPVHREEVLELVRADRLAHPQDALHAASILSRSRFVDDQLLASELAALAALRGVPGALVMSALAWDRWCAESRLTTRYGSGGGVVASSVPAALRQALREQTLPEIGRRRAAGAGSGGRAAAP